MPPIPSKLSEDQKADIAERFEAGETAKSLAEEFGVSAATLGKYLKAANAKKPRRQQQAIVASMIQFTKRARSILWNQDRGRKKETYEKWQARITELEAGGLGNREAIFQASKDFSCLETLFSEYAVSELDPHPGSHPNIRMLGESRKSDIESEDKEQSYRENLNWAIEAAGLHKRTTTPPATCPNDKAYLLYLLALDDLDKFLSKYTQVESKSNDDHVEQERAKKSGKRTISEIEEMLDTLEEEGEA